MHCLAGAVEASEATFRRENVSLSELYVVPAVAVKLVAKKPSQARVLEPGNTAWTEAAGVIKLPIKPRPAYNAYVWQGQVHTTVHAGEEVLIEPYAQLFDTARRSSIFTRRAAPPISHQRPTRPSSCRCRS